MDDSILVQYRGLCRSLFLRSLPSPCCLGWLCRSLPKIAWAKNPCWFKPAHPFARMPWVVAGFTYHILWWWDDLVFGLWGVNIDQISQVLWEFCGIPGMFQGCWTYFRFLSLGYDNRWYSIRSHIDRYMWGYDMISHMYRWHKLNDVQFPGLSNGSSAKRWDNLALQVGDMLETEEMLSSDHFKILW